MGHLFVAVISQCNKCPYVSQAAVLIVRAVVGVCAKLLCHGAASVRCVAFPSALHNLLHEHTANLTRVAHQLQIIKETQLE